MPKAHWIDAAANSIDSQSIKLLTHQLLLVTCKGHRQAIRFNAKGFPAITVKQDQAENQVVIKVKPKPKTKPKQIYTHVTMGDFVDVTLDKDRKQVKLGTYTARVTTPTKTGVEVKIDGNRISTKLFNFVHRSDGYDYNFASVLSI